MTLQVSITDDVFPFSLSSLLALSLTSPPPSDNHFSTPEIVEAPDFFLDDHEQVETGS